MTWVDLRSDTVTLPSTAMKQAMMDAPLGDDVLGDDPTVQKLEAMAAELSGKEAAIFTPSGSMANQIAIALHTRPGDEVLMEEGAHPFNYEAGGPSALSGVQIRPLPADAGILSTDTVGPAIRPMDDHFAPATLLCIEDTSNRGGGTVYPLQRLDELTALAQGRGLATHLDGARAMNAVVASGISLLRRAQGFDSVAFCLSKGLGAPVGSLLCGTAQDMQRGRRVRKLLGGGMRQSGILAGAGIYALQHNIERLTEDHRRATEIGSALLAFGYKLTPPQSNILYIDVPNGPATVQHLQNAGIRALAVGPTCIRLVTHLDVDDAGVQRVIGAFSGLASAA